MLVGHCGLPQRRKACRICSFDDREQHTVRTHVHTIGGLSAHGDQRDLLDWYGAFENSPPLYLIHGEKHAQQALASKIGAVSDAPICIAKMQQLIDI
jgi:metallo-beta-lactamase family protein